MHLGSATFGTAAGSVGLWDQGSRQLSFTPKWCFAGESPFLAGPPALLLLAAGSSGPGPSASGAASALFLEGFGEVSGIPAQRHSAASKSPLLIYLCLSASPWEQQSCARMLPTWGSRHRSPDQIYRHTMSVALDKQPYLRSSSRGAEVGRSWSVAQQSVQQAWQLALQQDQPPCLLSILVSHRGPIVRPSL